MIAYTTYKCTLHYTSKAIKKLKHMYMRSVVHFATNK